MAAIFNKTIFNDAIFNTEQADEVEDVFRQRARKANAGTYLLRTPQMRRDQKALFRKFSRPWGT